MADHLTEEEQVEAFKTWWKENWLSVLLPIVLVAGGVIFWNSYQDRNLAKAEAASDAFAEVLTLMQAEQSLQGFGAVEVSAEDRTKAEEKAKAIVENYGGTRYAYLSRLMLAKLEVESQRYDSAAANLRAVVSGAKDVALKQLAEYRLAKVVFAQKKYDEALALANRDNTGEFQTAYAELEGDIYFAKGDISKANAAYKRALESLPMEQFSRRGIINMKVENTAGAQPVTTEVDDRAAVQPSTNTAEPAVDTEASTSQEPSASEEPSANEEPSAGEEPSAS